jgi:hypothetical protein
MKHQGIFAANEGKQHRFMPPWIQTGWQSRVALIAGLLTLGVLGGAAIPILGVLAPAAIIGLLCIPLIPSIWLLTKPQHMDKVCLALVILTFTQDLPAKIFGPSLNPLIQAVILLAAPVGFATYFKAAREDKTLAGANLAFLAFLLISLLSTAFGRSTTLAAAYQLITNLKPLFAIIIFYAASWDTRAEQIFQKTLKIAWPPILILGILEWISPSAYTKIFPLAFISASANESLARATGPFKFAGHLAAIASQLALFFILLQIYRDRQTGKSHIGTILGYTACIILALSKGEMIGFAICGLMIAAFYKREGAFKRVALMLIVVIAAIPAFSLFFGESIDQELRLAGVTRAVGEIDHPRVQIFSQGFGVANRYWPLGSGLGTYAGAGAEKFDTSLYDQLGFNRYWWYGRADFLMDTYWPNPIAETGYIGSLFILLCYTLLFFYAFKKWRSASPNAAPYWGAAAAGMLFSTINSVSTPAYTELRTYIFAAIFFGAAFQIEKRALNMPPDSARNHSDR